MEGEYKHVFPTTSHLFQLFSSTHAAEHYISQPTAGTRDRNKQTSVTNVCPNPGHGK